MIAMNLSQKMRKTFMIYRGQSSRLNSRNLNEIIQASVEAEIQRNSTQKELIHIIREDVEESIHKNGCEYKDHAKQIFAKNGSPVF